MISIEELRRKYHSPKTKYDITDFGDYCVGGAFCLEMGWFAGEEEGIAMPNAETLGTYLFKANDRLDMVQSYRFALQVVDYNDVRAFDLAWDKLDEALKARG